MFFLPPLVAVVAVLAPGTPRTPARATPAACAHLPAPPSRVASSNDNREPAGRLEGGALTIRLVAHIAAWRPDGSSGCALGVHTFAEEGKAGSVPGPLIRVAAGTQVRAIVRNALPAAIWVRGLQDRAAGPRLDSVEVLPGKTHEFRFTPSVPGAWFYWAGSARASMPTSDVNGQLVGALVVDSAGHRTTNREDRVFVLTRWSATGLPNNNGFQLNAINGRSWPNTERLPYVEGDSVRWHVINASNITHEMHLHGFFFRIDDRGFVIDSVVPPLPVAARMRVTSVMRPNEWIQIAWVPDRPGNWLFHCHLLTHMSGAQRLDRMSETSADATKRGHATDAGGTHAAHDMGGLVMALEVHPRTGAVAVAAPAPARTLDLYANSRPDRFGHHPGYGFVLKDGSAAPAPDSIRIPGSPLVLTKDEPVQITVHNRLTIPISVHWHGLELDSYFDGVGGFSGEGRRVAPMIAPGDSFAVRLKPPRAGTYMYHIHGERGEELASGLYGHLVVADRAAPFDAQREPLFAIADGGPGADRPIFINGSATPDTLVLATGTAYRFRLIYITNDDVVMTTLRGPAGVVPVRFAGIDGFDTPNAPARPMQVPTGPGHTRDLGVTFATPGEYSLIIQRLLGGPMTTAPIRVKSP